MAKRVNFTREKNLSKSIKTMKDKILLQKELFYTLFYVN